MHATTRMFVRTGLMLLAVPALAGPPGPQGGGVTLLPNGWRIAPAGRHITVGDLPLAMVESPDGRYLIVSNNGYAKPTLVVVDTAQLMIRSKVPLDNAWLGLAWHPDGTRLYSSGAGESTVKGLRWASASLSAAASFVLRRPSAESFVAGIAVSPDGSRLFAVHALGELLSAVDLTQEEPAAASVDLPAEGYAALASPDGRTVYVSLWGGAKVLAFDAATLQKQGEIPVGEHPNAMAFSKDGARLFVACANTNAVWVVDLASHAAKEQVSVALHPGAPAGS